MALRFLDMGIADYSLVLARQEDMLRQRIAGLIDDTVIFVEHYPVVTLGKDPLANKFTESQGSFFADNKIEVFQTDRGGGITYHGPGQLLVYPIISIDLADRDVSVFIDLLEKTAEKALSKLGVEAYRDVSKRGVWAGGKKIAFTGLKFKNWISYHGISVNINNDLIPFSMMDPCGVQGTDVVSASQATGHELDMGNVKVVFAECFAEFFCKGREHVFTVA